MMSKSLRLALLCMIAWSVSGMSCIDKRFGIGEEPVIYYAEGEGYAVEGSDYATNSFTDTYAFGGDYIYIFPTYQDALNFVKIYQRASMWRDLDHTEVHNSYESRYPSVDVKVVEGSIDRRVVEPGGVVSGYTTGKWRKVDGPVKQEPATSESKPVPPPPPPPPRRSTETLDAVDRVLERTFQDRHPAAPVPQQ